jgi:hypothetical protein
MPGVRRMRLARRLAGGMTPAEVARAEDTTETEILSFLADPKFRELMAYFQAESELPEDERERLLIDTAMAELWHLVDMGDTKVLLFLAYEADRGRVPENRLSRLAPPLPNRGGLSTFGETAPDDVAAEPVADVVEPATPDAAVAEPSVEAPVAGDVEAEMAETATSDSPAAESSIEAPARTASAETLSDPAAFTPDTPERDAWIRRYFESRQGLVGESQAGTDEQPGPAGESRAEAEEQKRRAKGQKSGKG